jgi:hypothetical protein
MLRRFLASIVAMAVLAIALSACGSSSGGSSSEQAEGGRSAVASEAGGNAEEPEATAEEPEESSEETGGAAEIASIMRREIYGRWGGTSTEFEVAGGGCKIDKINTTEAEIKAGGEAILDQEHNASVLVTPVKRHGQGPTAEECQAAVAMAIG